MTSMPANSIHESDPRLERAFVEREQNRLAARALLVLVILNGAASLVLLAVLARAPDASVEPKLAAAMLFFAGGAVGALLSSFIAYVNRAIRIEAPERKSLQGVLRIIAILSVIGSGAAFLTGMNMVGVAASEKSSSHPKGAKEKEAPAPKEPKENAPAGSPKDAPAGSPNDAPAGSPKDAPAGPPKDSPAGPPKDAPAGSPNERVPLQHEASAKRLSADEA